jgi:hypothetical protein
MPRKRLSPGYFVECENAIPFGTLASGQGLRMTITFYQGRILFRMRLCFGEIRKWSRVAKVIDE